MQFRISALLLAAVASAAIAQPSASTSQAGPRATVVAEATLYVAGDLSSPKVGRVVPGREMVVAERSGHWVRVFANTDIQETSERDAPVFGQEAAPPPISGWIEDKGVVTDQTPNGDRILFGAAIAQEETASDMHGATSEAQSARLLYRRCFEIFPSSSLAPEAAWRSADILWQLEKADASTRPSAHEREAYLREQLDDTEFKKIEKRYPGTAWADMAAYARLDNKLCGDWQGSEKCPEQESEEYEKFIRNHPSGARTAQAMYNVIYRQAVLVDMYAADDNKKKSDAAKAHAIAVNSQLSTQFATTDFAARAATLVYKLEQQLPVYGIDRQ